MEGRTASKETWERDGASTRNFSVEKYPCSSDAVLPEKNQGFPKTPLPIITPSQPYSLALSSASFKLATSPLPMSKISLPLFSMHFLTFLISSQFAGTSESSFVVLK